MTYNYRAGIIIPFTKKFYKQLMAAVAAIFIASFSMLTLMTQAATPPNWKAVAGSQINFSCGGSYVHTLDTVAQGAGGNFTGTGHYNPDSSYTWNLTGNITGDSFTFSILYTGASSGSVYNATNGVINPDGSATATVDFNCQSLTMAAGSFKPYSVPKKEVDIRGNTGIENQKDAWMFNRDASTSTPFTFTTAQKSLHKGSLYVKPIGTNASNKFIAENFLRSPVSDLSSIAYDFKIAGSGTAASANQFYLNVYTNFDNSTNYYKCRFDYVPSVGSTSVFTTATFNVGDIPAHVQSRNLVGSETCPTTLAGMPSGSYIRAIALNVGDTSTSDIGLAGYLDKVVITTTSKITTYDFEPRRLDKEDCKKDGWRNLRDSDDKNFRNQGDCVSHAEHENHENGDRDDREDDDHRS